MKRKFQLSEIYLYTLVSVLIIVFLCFLDIIKPIDINNTGTRFSIIGINATLAGFVFTAFGIMVSFLGNKEVRRLDKYGFLDNFYINVRITIMFNISSIATSLIMIFYGIENEVSKIDIFLAKMEISLFILSFILFMRIVYTIKYIIDIIRE